MEQELNLNCFDCKKSLQDCTCMEDTIDMKQETLDEVANEYAKYRYSQEQGFPEEDYYISFLSFRAGAKWQQERSYSEEDMQESFVKGALTDLWNTWDISNEDMAIEKFKEWFEQFKKK